jgi:hypothetical protein
VGADRRLGEHPRDDLPIAAAPRGLAIGLLTDPHTFNDDDTQQLLDSYVEAIRQWNRADAR